MNIISGIAGAVLVFLALAAPAAAQDRLGIVLMHGKQGSATSSVTGLPAIASALQAEGHKVLVPTMPWSAGGWENIRITIEQAHELIDGYAAELRGQGASRIVVGGHSLGANVALSYAVARGNVAGVVMMAPGHNPAFLWRTSDSFRKTFEHAVELVQAGQGSAAISGVDNNQGINFTISTTAAAYVSWMNPRGMGAMDVEAPKLPARIPVFLVIGDKDPAFPRARTAWYEPAAKNPYSKYLEVGADHRATPLAASKQIVEWIGGLLR